MHAQSPCSLPRQPRQQPSPPAPASSGSRFNPDPDGYSSCLSCFSGNLRKWRAARGRKIADVASEFGVATSTWGHWENGGCLPTGENLCLLAEFTRIPIQHLICPNSRRCPFTGRPATVLPAGVASIASRR